MHRFLKNTHYFLLDTFFLKQKPPEAAHLPNNRGLFLGPRFLCMHKILVHAQHSCACTTLLCMHWRGQGPRPGPNKKQPRVRPGATVFVWVPALVPGPSSACTRVLFMHKSVVHAQESCAFTRVLCMHNTPFYSYIIINIALKHFHTRLGFLVHLHLRRIQWAIVNVCRTNAKK